MKTFISKANKNLKRLIGNSLALHYYFSIFLLLFAGAVFAQTSLDIKRDFGAIGDGKTDDTKAFVNASLRIERIGRDVILNIPKGVYKVSPQYYNPNPEAMVFSPVYPLKIVNSTNVKIVGNGAKVIFADGLYFGSFKRLGGKRVEPLKTKTVDYKFRAEIGHGIYIENSSNISVDGLELDGNLDKFKTGGEFGDVGIQIDNDGLFIKNVTGLTLKNINAHHFGRDGIQIINDTKNGFNTASQKLVLENCRFEYNARQGFSWTGGVGLKATNCSFSYTGAGGLFSAPGAGVDFEPNAGYIVMDGVFTNCRFLENGGVSVLTDMGGFNVKKIRFENCNIKAGVSPAIWITSPEFLFLKCTITGTFYFGCAARNKEEGTRFVNCNFTDQGDTKSNTKYLIESNGAKFLQFDNCKFYVHEKGFIYIAAGATNDAEWAQINNCRFITKYANPQKPGRKLTNYTTGVELSGKTIFIDSSFADPYGWNLENTRFVGRQGQANEIIIGKGFHMTSWDKITIGDGKISVNVIVSEHGVLAPLHNTGNLIIKANAKLIIKKGGRVWVTPGSLLDIKGELIVEDGGILCIDPNARIDANSLKRIYLKGKTAQTQSGCRDIKKG